MSLGFAKQIIRDLVSLCTVIEEFTRQERTWQNVEVSEFNFLGEVLDRRKFRIFHNNSCLLEFRRVWYQATEYAILLRKVNVTYSCVKSRGWLRR